MEYHWYWSRKKGYMFVPESLIDEDADIKSRQKDDIFDYFDRQTEYSTSIDASELFSRHDKAVLNDFSWASDAWLKKRVVHKLRYWIIAEIVRKNREKACQDR